MKPIDCKALYERCRVNDKSLKELEKKGLLLRIFSKVLDEMVCFISNDEIRSHPEIKAFPAYTYSELRCLVSLRVPASELKILHEAKKIFNGKITG